MFNAQGKLSGFELQGDGAIVNYNLGLGYNALFGDEKNIRFSLEIGPRLVVIPKLNNQWAYFFHFNLMSGNAF